MTTWVYFRTKDLWTTHLLNWTTTSIFDLVIVIMWKPFEHSSYGYTLIACAGIAKPKGGGDACSMQKKDEFRTATR